MCSRTIISFFKGLFHRRRHVVRERANPTPAIPQPPLSERWCKADQENACWLASQGIKGGVVVRTMSEAAAGVPNVSIEGI